MPCALVEFSRRPGDSDGNCASDKVGWAGEYQGDGGVEAKGLDDCRELHHNVSNHLNHQNNQDRLTKFLKPLAASEIQVSTSS